MDADDPIARLQGLYETTTEGHWVPVSTGDKSNDWAIGTWAWPDGSPVSQDGELGEIETERFINQGEPDDPEMATVIEQVCENPSDGANFMDAHFIAAVHNDWPKVKEEVERLRSDAGLAATEVELAKARRILQALVTFIVARQKEGAREFPYDSHPIRAARRYLEKNL